MNHPLRDPHPMAFDFFDNFNVSGLLKARRERALARAIEGHDLNEMSRYLELGVRKIDHMRYQSADFGTGGQRVPAGKYHDPYQLAKDVGLPAEGLALLNRYQLGEPAAAAAVHAPTPRGP